MCKRISIFPLRSRSAYFLALCGFACAGLLTVAAAAQDNAPAGTASTDQPDCLKLSAAEIPYAATVKGKVTGTLDSAHLKAGKHFWITAAQGMVFPDCTIEQNAPIYGTITSASSSKAAGGGELSIALDQVECSGKGKKPMKFLLVGIEGPPGSSGKLHDAVPTQVAGGGRNISDAVAGTKAYDAGLGGAGGGKGLTPGTVRGLNGVKLDPQGGPACSAKLTTSEGKLQLPAGTTLLLGVPQ